jgi:microcystin degradation protein MlrC
VVLCSTRAETFSPAVFAALGSDFALKTIGVVKSSNHVHAAFALIAAGVISVDCGGSYPPDSVRIPDTTVRQQIWSLDPYPFAAIG